MDQQIEKMNLGLMALETGKTSLSANGQTVQLKKTAKTFSLINSKGEKELEYKILEIQK